MDLNKLKDPESKNILSQESLGHSKHGRLTASIIMMITPDEKQKLGLLGESLGIIKLSPLLRHLLKKHGYI